MTGTRKDWLKWVAAGFALVATASAEYELARAIGMNQWIAAAVPGALDAYAVRALRAHREVFTAVLAMIGVNASSHLVTAGVLQVGWPLITAVSAIAPLVLWRVHALSTPEEVRARVLWAGGDEHERVPDDRGTPGEREHPEHSTGTVSVPAAPEHAPCPCEHVTGTDDETLCMCSYSCSRACDGPSTFDEHADQAVLAARWDVCEHGHAVCEGHAGTCLVGSWDEHIGPARVPLLVPKPTSTPTVLRPDTCSECEHETSRHREYGCDVSLDGGTDMCPCEHVPVPPLPDTFPASTFTDTVTKHVRTGVLLSSDTGFMERARVLMGQSTGVPTVRAIKSELGVGTPRAQRLCAALTIEREGSTS